MVISIKPACDSTQRTDIAPNVPAGVGVFVAQMTDNERLNAVAPGSQSAELS